MVYLDGGDVQVNAYCKYKDKNGKIILDPAILGYSAFINDDGMCSEFSEGLLLVADKNGKWLFIDNKGEVKIITNYRGWYNGHDAPLINFAKTTVELFVNKY